jgi:hypothetical protein
MKSIAIAWLAALSFAAFAFAPADLQRLVKANAKPVVAFQEIRESPWLSAPVVSKGSMRITADGLEKRVESPRRETWLLLADRVEWHAADGRSSQISFSQAPALGALAKVLERVVAGDFVGLEKEFEITLAGDEHAWRALLAPRDPQVRRALESIEVQGTGGNVQVLIVIDRQGEKTTTRLQP